MTIKLRHYQETAINNLWHSIVKGNNRNLLQASTGAGKTIVACEIIKRTLLAGNRVLVIAHRRELILQTSAKLDDYGIEHGIIMGKHERINDHAVQVASIQTLMRRDKPAAKLIIIDETHLACSKSYKELLAHYPDACVIGLTATPTRTDGKGLGEVYNALIEVVPMAQLIEEGFLVKPRVFAPYTPDMSKVHTVRGDYDAVEAAVVMDNAVITGDIVTTWQKYALDRPTIAFASSVQHSRNIVAEFEKAGISARHLDAKTPAIERDTIINDFKSGAFKVLSNMAIMIEGFDHPPTSCVILARPTKSLTIYLQAAGRIMRPHESKTDCVILDHAGLTAIHDFVDVAREWSLEPNPKKSRLSNDEPVTSVTQCPECFCAYDKKLSPLACPECGAGTEQPEVAEVHAKGELIELTPALMLAEAQRIEDAKTYAQQLARKPLIETVTFADFINAGAAAGYKDFWAAKRWDERSKGVVYA